MDILTSISARATCVLEENNNVMVMYFRVSLDTDQVGSMTAIDRTDFNLSPKRFTGAVCTVDFDTVNLVYSVVTTVDLDAAAPNTNNNLCGMVRNSNDVTNAMTQCIY